VTGTTGAGAVEAVRAHHRSLAEAATERGAAGAAEEGFVHQGASGLHERTHPIVEGREPFGAIRAGLDAPGGPPGRGPAGRSGPRGGPSGVEVVRVYEDPGRVPGEHRVLVDRLWPRGLSKSAVQFDEWAKEVAPSDQLRRWYGHEPSRFAEFARRYREELAHEPASAIVARLRSVAERTRLVLLTATRDVERSGAKVLKDVIAGDER
jgi:uncharacterized protein YeaO (DUF488 family)